MIKAALDSELLKIVNISESYGAKKVLLFGSYVDNAVKANDIDIAVSGIPPRKFFEYYAEVSTVIKENVDIIDLEDTRPYFRDCITREGKVIYERKD